MNQIIKHGISLAASLDPKSQKEMLATLTDIFSKAGNQINFDTPENRKELQALVGLFRDMFESVGKGGLFDFSKMMKLPGEEMFAEMKVAAKEFEGVWKDIVTRMGSNSLSSIFMKNQSELSVALERMTNASGNLIRNIVRDMQQAFKPVTSTDINKLLGGAQNAKDRFIGAEDWESRATAALKYLNIYQQIMKVTEGITPDKKNLDAGMDAVWADLKNLGPYAVEQIQSAKPAIQASLQNLFNLHTGKPMIGLTDGGAIDFNVAPKVIKTLDVYDVLGGKTELGVNVIPEIDPGFKDKLQKIWQANQDAMSMTGSAKEAANDTFNAYYDEIVGMFSDDKAEKVQNRLERFLGLKNVTDSTLGTAWRDFYGYGMLGGTGGSGDGDGSGTGSGAGDGSGDASSDELANLQKQLANKESELASLREEQEATQRSIASYDTQLNAERADRIAAEQREAALIAEIETLRQQIANMSVGGLGGGGIVGNNALQQLQKDAEVASKALEDAHNKLSSIIQAEEELDWQLTSRGLVDYAEKYQNAATMKKQEVDNLRRSFTKKSDHKSNVDAIEGVIQNLINNEALGVNGMFTSPKDLSEFTDYKFAVDTGATNKVLNGLLNSLVNKLQREVLDTMNTYKSWGDIQSRDNPDADSLIEQRRRLAKEHTAATKAYNEAANAQSEAYEKLHAAQDRSGGLDGSAGATQEDVENARKVAEYEAKARAEAEAREQANARRAELAKQLEEVHYDEYYSVEELEAQKAALQEILNSLNKENLLTDELQARYDAINQSIQEQINLRNAHNAAEQTFDQLNDMNHIREDGSEIDDPDELQGVLERRKELMRSISELAFENDPNSMFQSGDDNREYMARAEQVNASLERRIELLKQVKLGLIDIDSVDDIMNETGSLESKLERLGDVANDWGSKVKDSDLDDDDDAIESLQQFEQIYDRIVLKLANGKNVEILPNAKGLRALYKYADGIDLTAYGESEIADVEFVRKEIEATTQAQEKLNAATAKYVPVGADGKPTIWGDTEDIKAARDYVRNQNGWGKDVRLTATGAEEVQQAEELDEITKQYNSRRQQTQEILNQEKLTLENIVYLLKEYNQMYWSKLSNPNLAADAVNLEADIEKRLNGERTFEWINYASTMWGNLEDPKLSTEAVDHYAQVIAKHLGIEIPQAAQKATDAINAENQELEQQKKIIADVMAAKEGLKASQTKLGVTDGVDRFGLSTLDEVKEKQKSLKAYLQELVKIEAQEKKNGSLTEAEVARKNELIKLAKELCFAVRYKDGSFYDTRDIGVDEEGDILRNDALTEQINKLNQIVSLRKQISLGSYFAYAYGSQADTFSGESVADMMRQSVDAFGGDVEQFDSSMIGALTREYQNLHKQMLRCMLVGEEVPQGTLDKMRWFESLDATQLESLLPKLTELREKMLAIQNQEDITDYDYNKDDAYYDKKITALRELITLQQEYFALGGPAESNAFDQSLYYTNEELQGYINQLAKAKQGAQDVVKMKQQFRGVDLYGTEGTSRTMDFLTSGLTTYDRALSEITRQLEIVKTSASQLAGLGANSEEIGVLEENLQKRKEIHNTLRNEGLLTEQIEAQYNAINQEILEKITLLQKAQGVAVGAGGTGTGTGTGGAEVVPTQTIPDGATSAEVTELEAVRAKVEEVTAAVNTKTQAFFAEQSAVKRIAKSEVHALGEVEKKVTAIRVALNNIKAGSDIGAGLSNITINVNTQKSGVSKGETTNPVSAPIKTKQKDGTISHGQAQGESGSMQKTLDYYYWLEEQLEQHKSNVMYAKALNDAIKNLTPRIADFYKKLAASGEADPAWLAPLNEKHNLHMSKIRGGQELAEQNANIKEWISLSNRLGELDAKINSGLFDNAIIEQARQEREFVIRRIDEVMGLINNPDSGFARAGEANFTGHYDTVDAEKSKQIGTLISQYEKLGQLQAQAETSGAFAAREKYEQQLKTVQSATQLLGLNNQENAALLQALQTHQQNAYISAKDLEIAKEKKRIYTEYIGLIKRVGEIDGALDTGLLGGVDAENLNREKERLMRLIDDIRPQLDLTREDLVSAGATSMAGEEASAEKQRKNAIVELRKEYERLGQLQADAEHKGTYEAQEKLRIIQEEIDIKQRSLQLSERELEVMRQTAEDARREKLRLLGSKQEDKDFKQQVRDSQRDAGLTKSGSVVTRAFETLNTAKQIEGISPEQIGRLEAYQGKIKTLKSTIDSFPRNRIATPEEQKRLISQRQEVDAYTKEIQELIANYERLSGENSASLKEGVFVDPNAGSDVIKQQLTDAVRETTRGRASIKGFNYETNELSYTLKNTKGELVSYTAAVRQTDGAMRTVRGTSTRLMGVFESIGHKIKEYSYYFTGSMMIYRVIAWVREGITAIKDIDSALTELKKVTDATEESYEKFLDTAAKTADKVGSTIKEVVSSTADWARLGYSMKEAAELATSTQILMNVSEFTDVNQATDSLISSIQAFKYTAEESMDVVDILNTIGNNYAISTADLAQSLTKSSGSLVAANGTLEEAVALTAAAM